MIALYNETPMTTLQQGGHEWTITRLHRAIPGMGRFIVYRDGEMWNDAESYKKGMEVIEKYSKPQAEDQTQRTEAPEPELEAGELEL